MNERDVFLFELACYSLAVDWLYIEAAKLRGVDPPVGATDWAALASCVRTLEHDKSYACAYALAWTWSANMELAKHDPRFDFHKPWESEEGASLVQLVHEIVGDNPFEVEETDEPLDELARRVIELGSDEEL
jgi:hypothetical protein